MASNNTTAIDQVVDPIAIEQFIALQASGKELRSELVQLLEVAVKLNATLGGSTPATFTKNLQASTAATEKMIANNNKQIENEAKKVAKQEEIYNKYLVMLSKNEAARQQADAREIADAEKKAAKLQAIAEQKAQRLAGLEDRFTNGKAPSSFVTQNPEPIAEQSFTKNVGFKEQDAKATALQTDALIEQKLVLGELSVEMQRNLDILISLESEKVGNAAEMKTLNAETVAGKERLIQLTAEQLRLKVAIAEVNYELSQETKQNLAEVGSIDQLRASVNGLRAAYYSLTVAERESAEGQAMLTELQTLDAKYKQLTVTTGQTQVQVGAYEKAINKATNASQLAALGVRILTRSLIRLVVQFALFSVAFAGIEWLYKYIAALEIFNPIATEAERRQKGLSDAFASTDYSTAVENIDKLGISLDLAKKGLIDSDTVVNQYNSTLGKTIGYVDTLTEAQKNYSDNAQTYIDMVTKEAAAQLILADNAKLAADAEVKNQAIREKIANIKSGKTTIIGNTTGGLGLTGSSGSDNNKQAIAAYEKDLADNNRRLKEAQANGDKAAEELLRQKIADQQKLGIKATGAGGATDGTDPAAALRNSISNDLLEREKEKAQKTINDEKQSYETRLKAANDFYQASYRIANNNEKLATDNVKLSNEQKTDIVQKFNNSVIQMQNTLNTTVAGLKDKRYKQEQDILKNDLTKQANVFQASFEDPDQSYKTKLTALSAYTDRSLKIIQLNYDEQVKAAGKNKLSLKIAGQEYDNAIDELANKAQKKKNELDKQELENHKNELDKLVASTKESEQEQIEALTQGATVAAQALQDNRDKLVNAKNTEYANGKISEQQYQRDLLAINDEYNVQRIRQEILVQQTILAIKEGKRDSELIIAKQKRATPDEIAKIKSDANKGIDSTKNNIAGLNGQLGNAQNKQSIDGTKSTEDEAKEKKDRIAEILGDAKDVVSDAQGLSDGLYESQISKLEKISNLINENARIEKAAIDRSLDTQANKARRQQDLDAQTASKQKAIQEQIAAAKTKQARADKVAAIAEIILNTAIAVIKLPAQGGLLGLAAVPTVIALGALQLAKAVATPIPQFYRGGTTKGGLVWYGEKGRELVEEPGRAPYYSPGVATLANLPANTKITANNMLPKTPQWESSRTDSNQVINFKIDQPKQRQPRLAGWVEAQRQADAWGSYSARHFK